MRKVLRRILRRILVAEASEALDAIVELPNPMSDEEIDTFSIHVGTLRAYLAQHTMGNGNGPRPQAPVELRLIASDLGRLADSIEGVARG